jgi:hypothetical protein
MAVLKEPARGECNEMGIGVVGVAVEEAWQVPRWLPLAVASSRSSSTLLLSLEDDVF